MKKRIFIIMSIIMFIFVGCGSNKSSDEAKALLKHNLQLVGIPPEIVVNICQDKNDNGTCDVGELQAKITVNENDTVAQMWEKVKFDELGRYILENYDPTLSIIMEIEDKENLKYDKGKLALKYNPDTQELSVLQALIDSDLLKEEDTKKLKELDNREEIDKVLLDSLRVNQNLLKDENLSTKNALTINLGEIAKGLIDLNISKELPEQLDACQDDKGCIQEIIKNTSDEVELTQEEAQELARSKNIVDAYIIKLLKPVEAVCANGKTYQSSLDIGEQGKINFEKFPVGIECNITVPSGATIDSNNNGKLDENDTLLSFDMMGSGDATHITPLTTLLYNKSLKGEDVKLFANMIENFDPVTAPERVISNSGIEKVKIEKIILLTEVLKSSMRQFADISQIDLSQIVLTNSNDTIDDLSIDKLIAKLPSDIKDSVRKKANETKKLVKMLKDLDPTKISLNDFFVAFSDGGKGIQEALRDSLRVSLPKGMNLLDFIIKPTFENQEKNPPTQDAIDTIKDSIKVDLVAINSTPIANAGDDQNVSQEESVTLDGSRSIDTDGTIESYEWWSNEKLLDNSASITLNDLSVGTHVMTLVVTDNQGAIGSDSVLITITTKEIPVTTDGNVTVPVDDGNTTDGNVTVPVDDGNTTDGNVTVPVDDGNTTDGNVTVPVDDGNTTDGNVTVPVDDGNTTDGNVTVPVDDGNTTDGNTTVTIANKLPTANAGADQTVTEGDSVYFNGSSSSDSDGNITAYEWKNGSTVVSTEISFYSSDLSVGTHTITLTVTDDKNATASDDVVITVNETPPPPPPENPKPVANAGDNKTITEGSTVIVDGSASTGDIKSYLWKEDGTVISEESNFTKDNFTVGTHTLLLEVTENDGDKATDTVTITVTEIEKTSKNVADGYIIKLASPAIATCNNGIEYNSSMSVGEKGKIIFPAVQLTSDCNISVASGAIIDSNNNGVYDEGVDRALTFEMKAPADATYISPLTTLLLAKQEKGEDVSELKALVKDFDPVTAVTTIKNGGSNAEKSKKLVTLMEVLKTTMENNASLDVLNDINLSTLTENNSSDFKDFNVSSFTDRLPPLFKEKANAKARVMKSLIELLPSIDSSVIDLESFNVAISDGGKSIEDAFKTCVRPSVSASVRSNIENAVDLNATLRGVLKNSYGSSRRDIIFGYFDNISYNVHQFHQGNFNFNFLDINSSFLTTRTLEITNIATLDGVYKVTSLDMRNDNDYSDSVYGRNYNGRYQKNESNETSNTFYIQTNAVSRFEVVDGLDSNFFTMSRGNRKIAYLDLKEGVNSPTANSYQDANGDGVYEVEIKITDVQMLETKTVVVKFAILEEGNENITVFNNPIQTKKGYISKLASVGGIVLSTDDPADLWDWEYDNKSTLFTIDGIEVESVRLEGNGSSDFEVIDNKVIKVANSLDYENRPLYNLKIIATATNSKEYENNLTIELWNDENASIGFENKEFIENTIQKRTSLSTNQERYLAPTTTGAFTKFEILDELDGDLFTIGHCCSSSHYNNNNNQVYGCLESNSNASYKVAEDKNQDGIYEVKVKATDIQTLESETIILKSKLVSSKINKDIKDFCSYDFNDYKYDYTLNQETVVGGEVPQAIYPNNMVATDVNITDMHLEGEGNEDFNITDNTITVVNSLDASTKNSYNLKMVVADSTGYSSEHNLTINLNSGQTHNEFNITNRNELKINFFSVDWYNWWNNNEIRTNNTAKLKFTGEDSEIAINMDYFNRYSNRHNTYFYWEKRYDFQSDEEPSYLNPKDSDGDNIYNFTAELTDIQTLEKQTLDYTVEVLSHQIRPYWTENQYDEYGNRIYNNAPSFSNNLEVNLSIPTEAPIGGELLERDGAKGFYLEIGRDISFDSAWLEGDGAEKFEVTDRNTIVLKEKVAKGDYNLTLVIKDTESEESRNPLYIHVGSIYDVQRLFKSTPRQKRMSKRSRKSKSKVVKNRDIRKEREERLFLERIREEERIRREQEEY